MHIFMSGGVERRKSLLKTPIMLVHIVIPGLNNVDVYGGNVAVDIRHC